MRLPSLVVIVTLWLSSPTFGHAQTRSADAADVVLVGDVSTPALRRVVEELLRREGIDAVFQAAPALNAEALLAAPDGNERVRVFIALASNNMARLYMRGPHGRRFLLREISLRAGLDELGRESVAQVVATSAHALLHSTAGVDRETARADLGRHGVTVAPDVQAARPPPTASNTTPSAARAAPVWLEAAMRDALRWTGGALHERWSVGAELGVGERLSRSLALRQRLVFEHAAAQTLDSPELLAFVRASALRLGQDVLLVAGAHAVSLGVLAGLDLLHVTPRRVRAGSWSLSAAYSEVVPLLRLEARYEVRLAPVYAAISAHCDASLREVHFDVMDGEARRRVAQSATLSPGLALTLGLRTF